MTSYKQDPDSWFKRNKAQREPYASDIETLSLLEEDKGRDENSDDETQNEEVSQRLSEFLTDFNSNKDS